MATGRQDLEKSDHRAAWLMAAPALLGLLLFIALPFMIAIFLAFTRYRLDSPLGLAFVGLEQFQRIFSDSGFIRALCNNTLFALIVVPLQTGAALILALLLNRPLRGMTMFRTLFFLPVVFPMALVAVVWELVYAPGPNGLLNGFLGMLSFGAWQPVDFLHHSGFAMPAIMLLSIWQGVGFQMVIILAGLQAIPTILYEAAALDGAGPWQRFFYITLPRLKNTLIFVALVTTILAFRLFDQVWILTQGGPQRATTTVMFEMVRAVFSRQDVARGAAMSVVFFIIVLAITLVQRLLIREEQDPR
ncbi:MAG: sugar ABC transporter permease [Desulfobacterales bacterium]|nr:sugar ABC transporter permease [Desulfobacterales bacterium]